VRKLGYLYTNSHQSSVENVRRDREFPSSPWLATCVGRVGAAVQESPRQQVQVVAVGSEARVIAVRRARGCGQGTACICCRSALAPESTLPNGREDNRSLSLQP